MALSYSRACLLIGALTSTAGVVRCSRSSAPPGGERAAEHGKAGRDEVPEALSVTRWTRATELFAEYPPLVAGQIVTFRDPSHASRYLQGADRGTRRSPPARCRTVRNVPRRRALASRHLRCRREAG